MLEWTTKRRLSIVIPAILVGGLAVGSVASAEATEPCSLFEAVGIRCNSVKLPLFQRQDGSDLYFRSAAYALQADRQTFACCSSGASTSYLFLVRASDLELVSEQGVAAVFGAQTCGIPIVKGLNELRGYLISQASSSGLQSFEGSEASKPPVLVEVRGRRVAPIDEQLGGGLCNMAGDTSLWKDPLPSTAIDGNTAFERWEPIGEVVLIHLGAEHPDK